MTRRSTPELCFAERQIAACGVALKRYVPGAQAQEPEPVARSLRELCADALANPVGTDTPPIAELASGAERIVVILSDATRDEPRAEMLDALADVLPLERVALVIATGTHARAPLPLPDRFHDLPVVFNEGHVAERYDDVGFTSRGTHVRILKDVARADLVIGTGRLRPHYFAGYSGGAKAVFPGCALSEDILKNHLLKALPDSWLGNLDENPVRLDMEEAAQLMLGAGDPLSSQRKSPPALAILNVAADIDGRYVAATSGHVVEAHRALVARAGGNFRAKVPRSRVVVVADRPPVSASLYQASKLLPPAAAMLEPNGVVIMVAECTDGTGPRERVNEGIYALGIRDKLPPHRVVLVSELSEESVATTYAEHAPSLRAALDDALRQTGQSGQGSAEEVPLLWRAGESVTESDSGSE